MSIREKLAKVFIRFTEPQLARSAESAEAAARAAAPELQAFARPGDAQRVERLTRDHRHLTLMATAIAILGLPLGYLAGLILAGAFDAGVWFAGGFAIGNSLLFLGIMRMAGFFQPRPTLEGVWAQRRDAKVSNAYARALLNHSEK